MYTSEKVLFKNFEGDNNLFRNNTMYIDEQHSRCLHHHSHLTCQLDQMTDREEYTPLQIKGSVSMELRLFQGLQEEPLHPSQFHIPLLLPKRG